MAGRSAIGVGATLAALLLWLLGGKLPASSLAQTTAELKPLEPDSTHQLDRYQVTLRSGAALWDIANTYLPLTALDQGDAKAYQIVLDSYQKAFPGRPPTAIQPDDSFVLEVAADTFVTQLITREGNSVVYRSFRGDLLTYYPRHPSLIYRLVRKDSPDKAEVTLTGQATAVADLAREIYQVDPPDFVQVRMIRAALNDRNARVVVDLNRKYLDDFRNYRERAKSVTPAEGGRRIYDFGPYDKDAPTPYRQVEDAVGDQTDPAAFPRDFRLAFHRDGTVRRYLVTEAGDVLAQLNKPDTARWRKVLPDIQDWQVGTIEPLPPFTPAVNQTGSLLPGRIMVLSFVPKAQDAGGSSGGRSAAGAAAAALRCLGGPVALLGGFGVGSLALGLVARRKRGW